MRTIHVEEDRDVEDAALFQGWDGGIRQRRALLWTDTYTGSRGVVI
jgi:hypothetical protein